MGLWQVLYEDNGDMVQMKAIESFAKKQGVICTIRQQICYNKSIKWFMRKGKSAC